MTGMLAASQIGLANDADAAIATAIIAVCETMIIPSNGLTRTPVADL